LKNSKVVSFLSPFKVGQAGNLWTLPRSSYSLHNWPKLSHLHSAPVVICTLTDEVQASNNQSTTPDLHKVGSGINEIAISHFSLFVGL